MNQNLTEINVLVAILNELKQLNISVGDMNKQIKKLVELTEVVSEHVV